MADAPPEPITLDEAKANLRVDFDDDDALITARIVSAREWVETETGLVLVPRQITETATRLGRWIDLTAWPVTSVDEIRYTADDGSLQVLDTAAYRYGRFRRPIRIMPAVWNWGLSPYCRQVWQPHHSHVAETPYLPVEIDLTAGYATPDDVPATVKQAMFLLISHFYANRLPAEVGTRAAAVQVPLGVTDLLDHWTMDAV
jgi:uncharacterized phiE125 gp8 family phage protein